MKTVEELDENKVRDASRKLYSALRRCYVAFGHVNAPSLWEEVKCALSEASGEQLT